MDAFSIPVFTCAGVNCPGCGAVALKFTLDERRETLVFGDRPDRVERTFRFTPCGCQWIPGDAVTVDLHFGEFPDWMPEEARAAWNQSGRAPVIAITARVDNPPIGAPGVTVIERDPWCCAPERNRR